MSEERLERQKKVRELARLQDELQDASYGLFRISGKHPVNEQKLENIIREIVADIRELRTELYGD